MWPSPRRVGGSPWAALAGRLAEPSPTDATTRASRPRAPPPRDRRTSTSGSVSSVGGLGRACPRRGTPSRRARGAQPHGALHAGAVGADLDLVAVADAEPLGVDGRELDDLARAQEAQRGGERRPPWRPTAGARAQPQRAVARRGAAAARRARGLPRAAPSARRPRARASAGRGRRSRRASARRRRARPRRAAREPSARSPTPRSSRRARATSAITCQPRAHAGAHRAVERPRAPIAGRRRCTRPSGCTSVPSFSA
jgi:hypothetical protein